MCAYSRPYSRPKRDIIHRYPSQSYDVNSESRDKEFQRILSLVDKLPDRTNFVEGYFCQCVDEEWTAHHAADFIVTDCIEDYQVFRVYDLEIDYYDNPSERANDKEQEQMDAINAKYGDPDENEYFDWDGYETEMDELGERIVERLNTETGDAWHDCEVGEYRQLWYNVKTRQRYWIGKICKGRPSYCDFDSEWEPLDNATTERTKFLNRFTAELPCTHYRDMSVHPMLQAAGYTGINAADWYYGCGEERNRSNDMKFFAQHIENGFWTDFLDSLVDGTDEQAELFKLCGTQAYFYCMDKPEDYRKDYYAAVKIVKRNNYVISDIGMWRDMVDALIQMKKDTHNAHYVCPEDLKAAHDQAVKQCENYKDKQAQKAYDEYISKWLDIKLSTDKFDIMVCPSVKAMKHEGLAMAHCVYSMGYYKPSKHCIILFVRTKENERISTVEIDTRSWKVAQNLGYGNCQPEYRDEVNGLLEKNMWRFRNAGKTAKIIEMKPNVAPAAQVAVAAA